MLRGERGGVVAVAAELALARDQQLRLVAGVREVAGQSAVCHHRVRGGESALDRRGQAVATGEAEGGVGGGQRHRRRAVGGRHGVATRTVVGRGVDHLLTYWR